MKIFFLGLLSLSILFFSACSTKEVFEPKNVTADWEYYGDSDERVIDISSKLALLESRKVLSREKLLDVEIEKSHRVLAQSDGWIISSSIDGKLTLQFIDDLSMVEKFDFKKTIAAASVKNDILAVLFADNEIALYSISKKNLLFKSQGSKSIAVNAKIVNPYFMNDLVVFLTLDGKVVIVNSSKSKKLRSVIVSSEDNFNNVIYFNVIDNKLIAATGYKILSMAQKEIRVSYEIRNMIYDSKDIFITTKQGEVISLTPDLQVNAKVKFPFAHFLGMIAYKDKLYILEKEGYIIELSKDLLEYDIYEVDIEDGFIFEAENIFYIDDKYISVE